jgi:hypothetical protein
MKMLEGGHLCTTDSGPGNSQPHCSLTSLELGKYKSLPFKSHSLWSSVMAARKNSNK